MPLVITDELLRAAGMTESEARVEIAGRLFDAGRLTIGHASRLAGMSEIEFEEQLQRRGLPRYRITDEMFAEDLRTLKETGRW